jgi:hypothetical protein
MSRPIAVSFSRLSQSFSASAPDPRTDSGTRHISITARRIEIERQVAGIAMRLAVPIRAYDGVLLACDEQAEPHLYRISLIHSDPDLSIELHRTADSPDVLALWRNWAEFFGKPALYGEASGQPQQRRDVSRPRPRRRGDQIAKRRPRFLKRRRGGTSIATWTATAFAIPAARSAPARD